MQPDYIETLVYLISTPFYIIIIGLEIFFNHVQRKNYYNLRETITNVILTSLNMIVDLAMRAIAIFFLLMAFQHKFYNWEKGILYWVGLMIAIDFMYYWLHRTDHYCRLFWAVHVTHHSAQYFNLTVGFRSSVFEPLYRFVFYIPIALMGFEVTDIILVHSILQIYGISIHTEYIKRFPYWLELILVSPAHHRVHHASNVEYLDKNMGMTFIIWDRLFGTFQDEIDGIPIQYGLTVNPTDKRISNIVFHEFKAIFKDIFQPNLTFRQRMNYVFQPPGWSHDGSRHTSDELRKRNRKIE